jgi:uncharacterized membrane protein YczE
MRSDTTAWFQFAAKTGGAENFLEAGFMNRWRREGQKLGGMITNAVGVGMMIFLYAIPDLEAHQASLVRLIPLLIGVVLLGHALFAAPKE